MLRPRVRHNGDLHTINFCEFSSPQWSDIKQAHGGATVTGFSGQGSSKLWEKERNETDNQQTLVFRLLVIPRSEVKVWECQSLSRVWHFGTLWTVVLQAPLCMGILQLRILEWVAMLSSRVSSQPRDWTCVSYVFSTGFFTSGMSIQLEKTKQ